MLPWRRGGETGPLQGPVHMHPVGPLLGIDYGRKRIGLAVADPTGISTRPLGFLPRTSDREAAVAVAQVARSEAVAGIVIGLPLHAHGAEGENVRWVRAFVLELAKVCTLQIHEVDERYSSSEAEDALRSEGKWPPAHPGQIDAKAAAILLRRFLDGER